jgi:hypothetical protein
MPANDRDPGIVLVQAVKVIPTEMITTARFPLLWQTAMDVMKEVPGSDFIEIRAIRYDAKENDERPPQPAPDAE